MKGFLLGALALVAAVFVATAAGADTKTVQITGAGFTPRVTTIAAGDTVTWHNADNASHQVVANNGSFASPVLKPDDTWSHTFTAATRANYHDATAATHTGSVVVNGPAPGVSLASDLNTVVFRSGTTVTGAITSSTAGQQVTLSAEEYGKTTASAQVKSTGTAADGTFSFTVAPTIQTTYIAHWGNAQSTPVTVNVAPLVGFGRSGSLYKVRVRSDISYRGHFVWVQRHNAFGWRAVKRVVIGSNGRASFHLKLRRGRSALRVFLPAGQAGAGYVASHSRQLFVRR
jgi:plastocyanin